MDAPSEQKAIDAVFLTTILVGAVCLVALFFLESFRARLTVEAHTCLITVLLMGVPLLALFVMTPADITAIGFLRGDPLLGPRYVKYALLLALPFFIVTLLLPATHTAYPVWEGVSANASSTGPTGLAAWKPWGALVLVAVVLWQAFVLEFFFRGFLFFGLVRRMGAGAVLVQMIPYALLYVREPWPAAVAAWPAGFVLGFVAWRCRSFLPAALIHLIVVFFLHIGTAL